MPKKIPDEHLDEILIIVSNHPDGVGLSEIEKQSSANIPRRTLQYHLRYLTESGRLIGEGDRRGRIYRSALPSTIQMPKSDQVIVRREVEFASIDKAEVKAFKDKQESTWGFGGWD